MKRDRLTRRVPPGPLGALAPALALAAALAAALALGLLPAGCAGPGLWAARPRSPARGAAPAPGAGAATALSSARAHMAAGAYQEAIDDYAAERQRQPRDQALLKQYVGSVEAIKRSADEAYDRSDFAPAGRDYELLRRNFPRFAGFASALSFDRAQLESRLARCRKALASGGFQEYRQGNLDQAIALWQGLLAIDPDNAEIKAALGTATRQRQNLGAAPAR